MKVLIVGDTHGNADWLSRYIYPVAMTVHADAVLVLGDFGAWEHTEAGVQFMNDCNRLAKAAQIPLYWLHGNHDKHSHTLAAYEPNERGFRPCRDWVFYIPQGHAWTWDGVDLRSFGGAYSVDKAWRLQQELNRYANNLRKANQRRLATGATSVVASTDQTLWFPEEEMTDIEMDELLAADSEPKQIVLSHDKPFSAKPKWNRKDLPGCMANQLRLERALRAHQPDYWFHGHLHYFYVDNVQHRDGATTIIGLEPDDDAAEPGWKAKHTWSLVELSDGKTDVKTGLDVYLDPDFMRMAWDTLN